MFTPIGDITMDTMVKLTCRNANRADNGQCFVYPSVLCYALSEREGFDEITSETIGKTVKLTDEQIAEVVKKAYDIDLDRFFDGEGMIGNRWKQEVVIDFDNPITPISNGEDVAQSLYNALVIAWEDVA